jgi:hypothetical protein
VGVSWTLAGRRLQGREGSVDCRVERGPPHAYRPTLGRRCDVQRTHGKPDCIADPGRHNLFEKQPRHVVARRTERGSSMRILRSACGLWWLLVVLAFAAAGSVRAQPAAAQSTDPAASATAANPVLVGAYVNKIQDLSFRENRYTIDFYLWFRWKAEGALADYKPLESFEIINGKIESKGSIVEKKIGDINYAVVRVSATMAETWELAEFPFDSHTVRINIEDSALTIPDLVFTPDRTNSGLGDELDIAGWNALNFIADVKDKVYRTNYGDISLPKDARSDYSRFVFGVDLARASFGSAIKLLSTVLLATAVAFVAFFVKPSDLDARFGMGVGSLFAVAASAFISASLVPDSGEMTVSDKLHMVALGFIFATLLISALGLKLEVGGREELAFKIDRYCLVLLPLAFFGWAAWEVWRSLR